MKDTREEILAQMIVLARSINGIADAARNRTDGKDLLRPAISIHDGPEELFSKPTTELRSRVQMMEMTPFAQIFIGGSPDQTGPLLNLYRARLLAAILNDTIIGELLGSNGERRYEGCSPFPPTPEQREARMDINLAFRYVFKASDLL